ncbi:hypothetical protein TWF694_006445 [Orbilia ellipsospora]|uniref:Uncharacterized protein n=1 Tax=Orbilia ellipsospora TaxID=2528407 RepID=A0AAV9XRV3_9PEZI
MMETSPLLPPLIHHHPHQFPSSDLRTSPLPTTSRFTPISIAPKPLSPPTSIYSNSPIRGSTSPNTDGGSNKATNTSTSSFQITKTPFYAPKPNLNIHTTPPSSSTSPSSYERENWTESAKYDLLWSIVLASGTTLSTIPWDKLQIPQGHTQQSAAIILQDIALGKHHITHPTFTPSNREKNSTEKPNSRKSETSGRKSGKEPASKKRKLEQYSPELKPSSVPATLPTVTFAPENRLASSTSTSPELQTTKVTASPSPHLEESEDKENPAKSSTSSTSSSRRQQRRHRSESPIELDLTNPRITQFLKREGYMNADGTPAKRKRGRPTKDPFGLSVTLKKQLIKLDPNAPPMKKRGRPRKRFLGVDVDLDVESASGETGDEDDKTPIRGGKREECISPGLRMAIEKIGEEMDREIEGMLEEGRRDDESDEEGYEGSITEVWDADDSEEDGSKHDTEGKRVKSSGQEGYTPSKKSGSPNQMAIDAVVAKM